MNKIKRKVPPGVQSRLAAGFLTLLFCLLCVVIFEPQKGRALYSFFIEPFSSASQIGGLISMATPAIFIALGVSLMFQCRKYSFASIGAFMLSSALVTMFLLRGNEKPNWYLIPVALLIGILAGALVGMLPALLSYKSKIHVALSSLLVNYLVLQLTSYLLISHMQDFSQGEITSFQIPQRMWLAEFWPALGLRWGTLLAIVATIVLYLLLYRGKTGYGIRMVGASEATANYVGLSAGAIALVSQLMGGALAGLGGAIEMMGIQPRYQWNETFPFITLVGILAAVLVDYNPIWVPVSTLFLSYLWKGAQLLYADTDFPVYLGLAAAAVMVLVLFALRQVVVADELRRFGRWVIRVAKAIGRGLQRLWRKLRASLQGARAEARETAAKKPSHAAKKEEQQQDGGVQ
ncbi:MAG: ral nucleoside transport system permease protein [Clostridiales bacterium]|nr:ral nucleoside transport system permease protein [Clostridiales bacterium]